MYGTQHIPYHSTQGRSPAAYTYIEESQWLRKQSEQNIPGYDTKQELLLASPFKFNVVQQDEVYSCFNQLPQQVTSGEELLLLILLTHSCSQLIITYMSSLFNSLGPIKTSLKEQKPCTNI